MARILIVDDDPDIRRLLTETLALEGHEVQTTANGDEAPDLVRQRTFDLALVDIWLPGLNGLELIHRLRELAPDLPLALITARPTTKTAVLSLQLGVDDYLSKPFDLKEVRTTVARLTAPRSQEEMRRWQAEQLTRARPRLAKMEQMWERLTERERAVLRLVAQGKDNAQIGQQLCLAEQTVKNYVHRIYDKLGVRSRAEAVIWAARLGLAPVDESR